VDAFAYVDEPQDLAVLTRLLNRMQVSPALASAVCSLGIGYEQALETRTPDQIRAFNQIIRTVGRIACKERDHIPNLRTYIDHVGVIDESIESLVRIAGMDETVCEAENNRFRGYKCDVPKEVNVEQCGLNTNFTCEKGITSGVANCEIGAGNRCRLSAVGKQSLARADGRRRVREFTDNARVAYMDARARGV
jgi:hypothetical protein